MLTTPIIHRSVTPPLSQGNDALSHAPGHALGLVMSGVSSHPHVEVASPHACRRLRPAAPARVTPIVPGAIVTLQPGSERAVVLRVEPGHRLRVLVDTRDAPLSPYLGASTEGNSRLVDMKDVKPTVLHADSALAAGTSPQQIMHPAIDIFFKDYDYELGRYIPRTQEEIYEVQAALQKPSTH